jgi:hypothetical protein
MRIVAVLCLCVFLAGCIGTGRDRWLSGNWFLVRAPAEQVVARPAPKRTRAESNVPRECSALDLNARRKLSERCRLELKYKLARAAELRVEGHTIEEIAAIMRISTQSVDALLATTGSLTPQRE